MTNVNDLTKEQIERLLSTLWDSYKMSCSGNYRQFLERKGRNWKDELSDNFDKIIMLEDALFNNFYKNKG